MRSIEESKATPQSASDGVSQRMRVANPENRVALPAVIREGVATASCIGAEFIKSLIDPGKFPLAFQSKETAKKSSEKIFL